MLRISDFQMSSVFLDDSMLSVYLRSLLPMSCYGNRVQK